MRPPTQHRRAPELSVEEAKEYLRAVWKEGKVELSSREESLLMEVPEGYRDDGDTREEEMAVLIASMRKTFFDKDDSDLLMILGMDHIAMSAHLVLVQSIYDEMMSNGEQSYWLLPDKEYVGDSVTISYFFIERYVEIFSHAPHLLEYIVKQDNPLSLMDTLETVAESRRTEIVEKRGWEGIHPDSAKESIIVELTQALWSLEHAEHTPDGFFDLPFEILLHLIEPKELSESL